MDISRLGQAKPFRSTSNDSGLTEVIRCPTHRVQVGSKGLFVAVLQLHWFYICLCGSVCSAPMLLTFRSGWETPERAVVMLGELATGCLQFKSSSCKLNPKRMQLFSVPAAFPSGPISSDTCQN